MKNGSLSRACVAVVATCSLVAPCIAAAQTSMTMDAVCALASTVNCFDFETNGRGTNAPGINNLYYKTMDGPVNDQSDPDGYLRSLPNGFDNGFGQDRQTLGNVTAVQSSAGSPRYYYPKISTDQAEFPGGASLKFTMPTRSGSDASGYWEPVFKRIPNGSGGYRFAQFGPGGEFWVRFAMRQDSNLLTTSIQAMGGGFGGVKRLIVHGVASSGNLEETINDGWERRIPQMYSDSGTEDYGIQGQPGTSTTGCTFPEASPNWPQPPCRRWKANTWVVYHVHVIGASNSSLNNGVVELYEGNETTPIIRVTNANMGGFNRSLPPYTENGTFNQTTTEDGYGNLTFTLYSTDKDPSQNHPEAYMWIDNVVISKVRVPPIVAGGGGQITPNAPTALTAN